MDITNVKSGAMSRTGGSGTRGSARAEGVHERRDRVAGGRSGVGHKCPRPLVDLTEEAEQEQEQN